MFTVLWDNDGVLVDTEGLFYRATQTVLQGIGIDFSPRQFIEISLQRGESTFNVAAERGVSSNEIVRLRAERDRIYSDLLRSEPCVVEAARTTLETLHGRVRMGVVTSTLRSHFEIAHARSGFAKYFDFVVANEDYRRSKPHPEPYLTAIERHKLDPHQCLVVEDSQRGLTSAVAAGLPWIIVLGQWTRGGDFRQACKVVECVSAVADEVLCRAAAARLQWSAQREGTAS
jgi:HAD superfamily hydrolase (TIGR01509 family)